MPNLDRRAAAAYAAEPSQANLVRLQTAVEPPRQELFRRFNMAPGGTPVLVEMRGLILRTLAHRIVVLRRGRIVAELPPSASDEVIGRAMLGTEAA